VRVLLEALRLLQRSESAGAHKYQCRPCECSRVHKSASRGHKGANKGRESAVIAGEPKEAARV
jgi:hypothetical protein